ncbi:MFS transporter [Acinetobacter sp. NIPH 2699]|uniref:MFS transporter n=1 Tax=Acinetobacter sp. NIPH 2699 TaxID=2923433 RepID=UPI001F4B205E|nr:MFS transporter [Acinetobacter sp. NIPH 2699]MCH7336272.1 MFS transporter [Acinetobacter sp. NIPH 2699]
MTSPVLPKYSDKTRFMLSFILVASTAGLGIGTAKVAISLFAIELKASEFEMGLIAASQIIGILFMGLPTGALIQRFGPLILFSTGSLLAGIWYSFIPLVQQAWFLILCSTLVSFCMPLRFVSLNTVFMSQLHQIGAAKAGWFRGAHMIGFMLLGPMLAVWLIHSLGFAGGFWALATLFLVPVLIAPVMFKDYKVDRQTAPRLSWQALLQPVYLLKQGLALRYTALIEFASSAAMMYFTFFIVVIAIRHYDFSAVAAASLVSLYGVVYMVALFGAGILLEHFGEKRLYEFGFVLVAGGLLCLAMPLTEQWLWVGAPLFGLGLGVVNVVNLSAFATVGRRVGMANVSALSSFIGPVGSLLGSILGGLFGHVWGLQMLFFPLAAVFVGLIVLTHLKHPFGSSHAEQADDSKIDILTNVDG